MKRILLLIGFFLCSPAMSADGPPPAKVIVGKVVKEEVSTTQSTTGVLYYERVSEISTEVVGLVEEVLVSQGDHVSKGDLLVRLNTDLLEKEIALTRVRIEQADLRIEHAEKNFKRLETLYKSAGVSEKDFDEAQYGYQDTRKEKQAVTETLGKLLLQQQRSVIRAPFAGVVLTKNVDSGAWVQQGRLLVSLGSTSDLFVRAPIAENLLKYVQVKEKLQVDLNAWDLCVTGSVTGIDPVADVKTKNVFLKIRIPSMEMVAQNMSATVFVPSSEKQQLSVFPRAAVIKAQGKDFVYTVKEGKASIMPVNIVAYLGEKVAADNPGLVDGLVVIIEGNERLRPEQPVVVASEK